MPTGNMSVRPAPCCSVFLLFPCLPAPDPCPPRSDCHTLSSRPLSISRVRQRHRGRGCDGPSCRISRRRRRRGRRGEHPVHGPGLERAADAAWRRETQRCRARVPCARPVPLARQPGSECACAEGAAQPRGGRGWGLTLGTCSRVFAFLRTCSPVAGPSPRERSPENGRRLLASPVHL